MKKNLKTSICQLLFPYKSTLGPRYVVHRRLLPGWAVASSIIRSFHKCYATPAATLEPVISEPPLSTKFDYQGN